MKLTKTGKKFVKSAVTSGYEYNQPFILRYFSDAPGLDAPEKKGYTKAAKGFAKDLKRDIKLAERDLANLRALEELGIPDFEDTFDPEN